MKIKTLLLLLCVSILTLARAEEPGLYLLYPKANADNVSTEAKILVRVDPLLVNSLSNLNSCISVKSENKSVAGETILASDKKTLIFQPDSPFRAGAMVFVSLHPKAANKTFAEFSFEFRVAEYESGGDFFADEKPLHKTNSDKLDSRQPQILANGVSVPSDFPHVTVTTTSDKTADGYLFLHNIRDRAPYNIILDNTGSPVWYERWGTNELRRDFTVQKNGIITMTSVREEKKYVGYDQNFHLIAEFKPTGGFGHDGHELQVLENGNYLIIGRRNIRVDAGKYVNGGYRAALVEETTVQEFTPDHLLIFNWPALENLADAVPYIQIDDPRDKSFRFAHFNAVDVDKDDGNLLISSRMISEVTKVDREFGTIMWRLGGKHSDFRFVNDPFNGFSCQHDIRSLGNNLYSVFDNGNYHVPPTSRGVIYKIDEHAKTATLVWQYLMPASETFSTYMGSMQFLPNGNFLINWAVGELPKASEVTLDGELVYEMNFKEDFDTYRTFRHPWNGVVEKPRLFVEQDDVSTILIFNKFGDKDVAYYNIYGGFESRPTTLLDTSRTTMKRLSNLVDRQRYYFRVTAVYENGNESEFSNESNIFVNYLKPGVNMLQNGDFTFEDEFWSFTVSDADAVMEAYDEEMHIFINDPGEAYDCVQLKQENISLIQGKTYRLEFDAYASENRVIEAFLEQPYFPWNNYGKINPTLLRRGTEHYTYDFVMEDPSDYGARLVFNCGAMSGDVTLDNVSLMMLDNASSLDELPQPWENTDVGEPRHEGVAGIRDEQFVVFGGGLDIDGLSDEFHYAFQEMQGDVEISARLSAIGNTHDWAKAGLMIRETLNEGAINTMIGATAENELFFQYRPFKNESTLDDFSSEITVPVWLKLTKIGNHLSGYYSENGDTWTLISSEVIQMDDLFNVGIAVTSHNADALCSGYFDDVTIKTLVNVDDTHGHEPTRFELYDAYPNPFNPRTSISYSLPEKSTVKLRVYNIRGELVHTMIDQAVDAGLHRIDFDASGLSSGLYLYEIDAKTLSGAQFHAVNKMTVLK